MNPDEHWLGRKCEVCGEDILFYVTPKSLKHPPRAHKGHCELVLEEREGRVAKKNWKVIKAERKGELNGDES
jgi:hypothetical protein